MISVSYLKSKFEKSETLTKIDNSIADMIHVDLMDGIYVNDNNLDINEVINDLKDLHKPLDIHLMVKKPSLYLDDLLLLRPTRISFHLDIDDDINYLIDYIKDYNIEVGITINPDQNIHLIDKYIDLIDYVLIMGVKPGLGGQEFITDVINSIKYLQDKDVLIGIDGGINDTTIEYLKDLRVDNIISGSFVCMEDDYNAQIHKLK